MLRPPQNPQSRHRLRCRPQWHLPRRRQTASLARPGSGRRRTRSQRSRPSGRHTGRRTRRSEPPRTSIPANPSTTSSTCSHTQGTGHLRSWPPRPCAPAGMCRQGAKEAGRTVSAAAWSQLSSSIAAEKGWPKWPSPLQWPSQDDAIAVERVSPSFKRSGQSLLPSHVSHCCECGTVAQGCTWGIQRATPQPTLLRGTSA